MGLFIDSEMDSMKYLKKVSEEVILPTNSLE